MKCLGGLKDIYKGNVNWLSEQREIMRTLDASVKQLERTFSSAVSDEQQRTEKMLEATLIKF